MKKILFLLLSLLLPSFALHAIGLEVGVGGNQINAWGDINHTGTTLDVRNDFNLGQINVFRGRVRFETPPIIPNIYLTANPMKFEGTSVRTLAFTYGDESFSANVPFNTTLQLDHYDITLFYGLPFVETATREVLKVDVGLNVRYLDFNAEIIQPQSGLSESESIGIPIPMIFLALGISPVKAISIEGEIQGVGYSGNRYIDAAARFKVRPYKLFFAAVGYKFQNITIDQDDVIANLSFGGPTIGFGLEF